MNPLRFAPDAPEADLRRAIVLAGRIAYERGLLVSNDGNLSVRLLKRRGPSLAGPLTLALAPVLGARQRDRARGVLRGLEGTECTASERRVLSTAASAA